MNASNLVSSYQPHLNPNGTGGSGIEMLVSCFPRQASCSFPMQFLQPLCISQVPRVGPGWWGGGLTSPPVRQVGDGGETAVERIENGPDALHVAPHRHHQPHDHEEGAPHRTTHHRTRGVSWSVGRLKTVHAAGGRSKHVF